MKGENGAFGGGRCAASGEQRAQVFLPQSRSGAKYRKGIFIGD
jgi:hypothetical protein